MRGCIIQDMGYYPFGSKFFSDLVHYVRTRRFHRQPDPRSADAQRVRLRAGQRWPTTRPIPQGHCDRGESVGAASNIPSWQRKYGNVVTYDDDPTAHMKVEFGFDVLQVARGNYAPQAYHDFIGFPGGEGVLERAFDDTYALELKDVFGRSRPRDGHLPARGERRDSRDDAGRLEHQEGRTGQSRSPAVTQRKFVYNLSRASYRKEWDEKYQKPGIGARILAFLFRILPKVGPLKALSFRPPTPANRGSLPNQLRSHARRVSRAAGRGRCAHRLTLEDRDFDTGKLTRPGEYRLADKAYAKLARDLAEQEPAAIDPELLRKCWNFTTTCNFPTPRRRIRRNGRNPGRRWKNCARPRRRIAISSLCHT